MKRFTVLFVFFSLAAFISPDLSAQCVVTDLGGGNGAGTLRGEVRELNQGNCLGDLVTFQSGLNGTINLGGIIRIERENGTLDGSDAPDLVISGATQNNIIEINNTNGVSVTNLTLVGALRNGVFIQESNSVSITNLSVSGVGTSEDISPARWVGVNNSGSFIYAGILADRSNELLVENNAVFNNNGQGIQLKGVNQDLNSDSYSAIVRGNVVGVLADGVTPAGNLGDGIAIEEANPSGVGIPSSNVLVDGNHSSANGNRSLWPAEPDEDTEGVNTSSLVGAGILIGESNNCTVINNFVGTDATASSSSDSTLGNHNNGIYVRGSSDNRIGTVGNGNVVGWNGYAFGDVKTSDGVFGVRHGIQLHDAGASSAIFGNIVRSNFVGYFNGNCIPNRQDGISILGFGNGVSNNIIGGSATGEGNIIGGSLFGIFSQGSGATNNTFQGNFIGTDGPGLADIGCPVTVDAIVIKDGSSNNTVGGTTDGTGNYIANNPGNSVVVRGVTSNNNNIVGNIMSCNGGGVQLEGTGNNNFGANPRLAVNVATLTDDFLEGFSPNVGDEVDIYVADDCEDARPPCQAVGGSEDGSQGFRYVGSISSVENTRYDGIVDATGDLVAPEDGYFTFDFTSALATSNGLTRDNIIFAGRDAANNTSEFHKCVVAVRCDEPDLVEVTSNKDFFLCDGEAAEVTSRIETKLGDPSDVDTDFNYTLYRVTNTGRTVYSTNATGDFTIPDAGTFVLEASNVLNSSVCSGFSEDTIRVSIERPFPTFTITPTGGPFCESDENVMFTANGNASSTYSWTRSDDATYLGTGTTVSLPTVSSTFDITAVERSAAPFSCPQAPVSLTVTVNPLPSAVAISPAGNVCEDDVVVYSVDQTPESSYSWNVTAVDATIVENENLVTVTWGATSGTVEVIETNFNGCSSASASTLDVLVAPRPGVRNVFGPNPVCAGDEVTYSVTSNGSTYAWVFDGIAQASNNREITVTIPEKANVQVSVIETNSRGCVTENPSTLDVTINSRPEPTNLTVSPSTDICIGDDFTVSVDPQSGIEFLWSSTPASIVGSPSTLNELTLTGTVSGTIIVNAKNTSTSCESNPTEQLSVDIIVHDLPQAPQIDGPESVTCSQDGVGFSVVSPIATSSYVWTYGTEATGVPVEGDTVLNGFSTVVDFGPRRAEIQVSEIDQFGCASPLGEVSPEMIGCDPRADFISTTTSECFGTVISVTEFATYTDIALEPSLNMKFIFPGADVDTIPVLPNGTVSPTYTASGPGLYDVTLIVAQSGLSDTLTRVGFLEVKPLATIASETINGEDDVCQNFIDTYTITGTSGSIYSWSVSENGTLLTNGTGLTNDFRFGPGNGTTTITVTEDKDGCIDSVSKDVNILPSPSTIDIADQDICQDDSITISLTGADPASTFVWEPVGNVTATTATTATFVFTTPGDAQISVLETNTSGCVSIDSTSFATINVRPELATPVINGDDLSGICAGSDAQFSTAVNNAFTYNWSTTPDGVIDNNTASTITISGASAGTKTVSLFVFDGICTSGTTDSTYIVEDLPDAPTVSLPNGTICEGSEITLTVNNPVPTSTYEWSNLPEGTMLASGEQLIGVGNSTIRVILGPNNGVINVEEQTAIGCPSNIGSANLTVQNLLGDLDIIQEPMGGNTCTAESLDSLVVYNIVWENATDIVYSTDPDIAGLAQTGNGEEKQVSFIVPAGLLENQTIRVTATADADGCEIDTRSWDLEVKPSITIQVEFDKREVCQDESSLFTASLDSSIVTGGTVGVGEFFWFYNDVLLDSGITFNTPSDVISGDEVKLIYEPNPNDCPVIGPSVFRDSVELIAWQKPAVEGLVFGQDEYEITDFVNPVELNAELLIDPELVIYNYEFFWKVNEDSVTTLGISSPSGRITGDKESSSASLEDARSTNTKQRQYFVETSIQTQDGRKICPVVDSMLVTVRLLIDPPAFLCHEAQSSVECPTWLVENSDVFENNVTIFNRWGSVVYESSNGLIQWDGNGRNGRALPTGTYFYVIELSSELGDRQYSGPVSIIK